MKFGEVTMRSRTRILIALSLLSICGFIMYGLIGYLGSVTGVPNREVDWLSTLNSYRVSSGVNPVKENERLSKASQGHADYLASTNTRYLVGKYQNLHKENPESPYASRDGATVGAGVISWTNGKYASAVDNLMTAPFHAIGLLRENLVDVGFGTSISKENSYEPGTRITNITVLSGLRNLPRKKVILFPGPNFVTHLNSFAGESPEPREACRAQFAEFQGLPIFASLLHRPARDLKVSLKTPDGKILTEGQELCVVTENNFLSTDLIYGPAGKSIIRAEHLVLIIPRKALSEGKQSVRITESRRPDLQWSFSYKAPELRF